MMKLHGLVLLLASSSVIADGYGLITGEAPGSRPVGGAESYGGYGLVPSAVERHGVERAVRAAMPSRRSGEKRYLTAASRDAYVVPAARPALQPAVRPVIHQPAHQAQNRYSSAPVSKGGSTAGRYSQVQLDTRKSYSVTTSAERPLSDLMRAPVTFAKPASQPVRSLSQLPAPQPVVTTTQPVLPPDIAAVHLPATRHQGDQPDFSALKARLKGPSAPAVVPVTASAETANVVKGQPDFSALKARLTQPASANATSTSAAPSDTTSSNATSAGVASPGPDFSALQARLKPVLTQSATESAKAKPVAEARKTSALPDHAGRRSHPSVNVEQPMQLSPITSTASKGGLNGIFDSVADLLGAEPVKPWQKSKLAEQAMKKGGAIPALSKFSQKVHISKEASRGGYGVAGGGCGCN